MAGAIPFPWELLAPPRPAPRVSQGHVDAVLVDLTRPEGERFRIRVYIEEFTPPSADVVAAWVLYGFGLPGVVARLREEWSKSGLAADRESTARHFVAFEFSGRYAPAVAAVERLAGAFPP